MLSSHKSAFETYLFTENKDGSGKASSYLRALELLESMLRIESYGFEECLPIWKVNSPERLVRLRERVLEEQKKGTESPWVSEGIPVSYLRDGYCSAALSQLIEFLPQQQHVDQALELLEAHQGDEAGLADQLRRIEPEFSSDWAHDPESKDGQDRVREIKQRIGQRSFRAVILKIYNNRCCLTGLDLPAINRASHIIGWAERTKTRMDPRNGLCLSATYDAAFDRKLITFDEDYRMVLSKTIRDHMPSRSLKAYFLNKAGEKIDLPKHFRPLPEYLEHHRNSGDF